MIYIFWSCRDKNEAKKIIHILLEKRLIACASIFPEVESFYRWEGKIEESNEVKVILKTDAKHFDAIQTVILTEGSYQVPEIAEIDVVRGNPPYLDWLKRETALN